MTPIVRTEAGDRWRAALAAWAIPDRVLQAAHETPYRIPDALFQPQFQSCSAASIALALPALPDGGSVLDVGCGGGTASRALVPPAGRLVGVDTNEAMLDVYAAAGAELGIDTQVVHGSWPDAAGDVPPADVVVCQHVAYNVAAIEDFLLALTRAARHRVVLEVSLHHPQAELTPLWRHFHRLERPTTPKWKDLRVVLDELGMSPEVVVDERPLPSASQPRAELVGFARRRLCLTPSHDGEVDRLLPQDATVPPREVVCMAWVGGAQR